MRSLDDSRGGGQPILGGDDIRLMVHHEEWVGCIEHAIAHRDALEVLLQEATHVLVLATQALALTPDAHDVE